MSESSTVTLTLLGRAFRLAAPAGEEDRLRLAATRLERSCAQVAANLARPELERVLLLAALELAAADPADAGPRERALEARLLALEARIEQVLAETAPIASAR